MANRFDPYTNPRQVPPPGQDFANHPRPRQPQQHQQYNQQQNQIPIPSRPQFDIPPLQENEFNGRAAPMRGHDAHDTRQHNSRQFSPPHRGRGGHFHQQRRSASPPANHNFRNHASPSAGGGRPSYDYNNQTTQESLQTNFNNQYDEPSNAYQGQRRESDSRRGRGRGAPRGQRRGNERSGKLSRTIFSSNRTVRLCCESVINNQSALHSNKVSAVPQTCFVTKSENFIPEKVFSVQILFKILFQRKYSFQFCLWFRWEFLSNCFSSSGPTQVIRREDFSQVKNERVSKERPCRTLFVRNVKFGTSSAEALQPFEQIGDIANVFDLIDKRAMFFLTYFDVRAAMMAKDQLHEMRIGGRPLDVHFSLPKDVDTTKRCTREDLQGTLSFFVDGARGALNDQEIQNRLAHFGDVKRILPDQRADERIIEFYDARACQRAYDELNGQQMAGGKFVANVANNCCIF